MLTCLTDFQTLYLRTLTLTIFWLGLILTASAAETYEVKVETNVTMKTRDGVPLNADIYRPRAEGKFPVILERTVMANKRALRLESEPPHAGMCTSHRTCAGIGRRAAIGIPSNTNRKTAMTAWNGRRRCRIPMAKSVCGAAPTSAQRKCSRRLPRHHT